MNDRDGDTLADPRDREIHIGLEELCGTAAPPDRVVEILRRLTADRARAERPVFVRRSRRTWLAAALLLFAMSVVLTVAYLKEPSFRPAPATGRQEPVSIESVAELESVPADVTILSIGRMTAAALPRLAAFPELRVLSMGFDDVELDARSGRALAKLGELRHLLLSRTCSIRRGFLAALAELPHLEELLLRDPSVAPDAWVELPRLRGLRTLWLPGDHTAAAALDAVAALDGLRSLALRDDTVLDASALAVLARLAELETLDLHGCAGLDDATLERILAGCARLAELGIARCSGLTSAVAVPLVEHAARLRGLAIDGLPLTETQLHYVISEASGLTTLSIGGTQRAPLHLSDEFVRRLTELPALRNLGIQHATGPTAAGIGALSALPLEVLDATGLDVDDSVVLALAGAMPTLRFGQLPSGKSFAR
ncbi:MAG: hypothetical protein IPM29_31145 [Planctomycetes bacterium]|nr:hypothetical protein [Planctomycetota bacterium]